MVADEMYWELLEEQHEHDVVMTESRKENGSDRGAVTAREIDNRQDID